MRTRCAFAVAAALSLSASASAAPIVFHTPSKNIDCLYSPKTSSRGAFLRCDIRSGLKPRPKRSCELDWTGVVLTATGRGRPNCASDTVADPRSRVLAYGKVWRGGGVVCRSRIDGLRCTNRRGHGFFLSRQSYRVF
jgi:hypothetical protein